MFINLNILLCKNYAFFPGGKYPQLDVIFCCMCAYVLYIHFAYF